MKEDGSCASRSFGSLMLTQALGAFNDNVFRTVLKLMVLSRFMGAQGGGATYLAVAQGLFVLPYIIFSGIAGQLADKYSKSLVLRISKAAEVGVALIALLFFWTENIWGLFFAIFLMGAQSTFFSPAKYGSLPEILDDDELSKGNGYLEFWTFSAIVLGLVVGGFIESAAGGNYVAPALFILAVAVVGNLTLMPFRKLAAETRGLVVDPNPLRDTWQSYKQLSRHRGLTLSLWALSYFWFLATSFDLLIYMYAKRHLELGSLGTSLLLTSLMLGIGFGSIVAGKVSEGKVELGLVPIGGLGMALSCVLLNAASLSFLLTAPVLVLLGVSSGFFVVPLNAFYQRESPRELRGRFLALTNFTSFSAMAVATVLVAFLADSLNYSPREIFLLIGILTLAVSVYVTRTLPGALVRCLNWIVTHLIYRISVIGAENVPRSGGALLVANHVSFVDALIVQAVVKRPVRFLMFKPIFENRLIRPVAEAVDAIPVMGGPQAREAIAEARASIERGEIVCIFAEGSISRIGQLLPFKSGLERIMEGVRAAPIIPVYLDQLWGSIFSFRGGKFFWKVPKEIPYPVTVSFGKPLPADSSASQVRLKVQELGSRAFARRERRHKLLHLAFLSQAKRTPFRLAVSDTLGMKFRYFELLAGILLLRNRFRGRFSTGERVGVLLPAGCAGALTNLALLSQGLVPVNLNHTAGALSRIIERSNISTILTSHKYLEKISIERDPRMLPVEALLQSEDKWERLLLALKALLLPGFFIRRFYFDTEATQDSLATIMFSSGSTGEPKGVMLTHSNISSNCEAIYELLDLGPGDVLLGSLPFFHSFGFTGTLLLPLISGIKTHYHPNPTDAALITRQIAVNRITMLITTPTFLQMYARKASRADLCSLRYIVVGAEKLREGLRAAFQEKFGKEILEGYGCTELSPVALVNVPGFGAQIGNKPGTVGRPIPGVSVKVVNPDTLEELSLGESGMLLVAGPNVMAGYLDEPEKTAAVIRDGYYLTGDIASIDEDGFVKIEDRLSRFAKIGGEMVPHLRIEEEIHAVLDSPEQVVAVTSVPDERKGEKLVVVHAVDLDVDRVRSELAAKGLPNLWIPKREDFIRVENLPVLGTGKLDLKGLKEVVASGT